MDHANPAGGGVMGGAKGDLMTFEVDGPLIRGEKTVEDAHQRRLAGAVFSQERVDFALIQVKVDTVIGDQPAKPFGNALKTH